MRQIILMLAVLFVLGCANGNMPTIPDGSSDLTGDRTESAAPTTGKMLWGLYDVTIDPVAETAEAIPLRSAEFKVNILKFLQPPNGNPSSVKFKNIDASSILIDGTVQLDIEFTHPFPGFNKFTGFDVLGVFMSDASFPFPGDTTVKLPRMDGSEAFLVNADSYTRWFNATEFTDPTIFGWIPTYYGPKPYTPNGTVNGYKYYANGLGANANIAAFFSNPTNVQNRGKFAPSISCERHWIVYFPNVGVQPLRYSYACLASWKLPANENDPQISDFPPDANQAEPFYLKADTTDSTVFYENSSSFGGSIHIDLDIYDWDKYNLGSDIVDTISAIKVASMTNGFITGNVVEVLGSAIVTPGGQVYDTFSFDIAAVNPTHAGSEYLVIRVENTDPNSYDQGFPTTFPTGTLASYLIVPLTVLAELPLNQAPSVGAISGEQTPFVIQTKSYTVAAIDPEDDPLTYEWSLVGDGQPVNWGNVGSNIETILIDWNLYGIGDYDLYARVKDDFNPWQGATNNPYPISVQPFSITCTPGGEFGYFEGAWAQHQGWEAAFLSDGTVLIEHGYTSLPPRDFQVMTVMYGWDIGGYCYYTPVADPCENDWCEEWDDVFFTTTDGFNYTQCLKIDPANTWGPGTETDDIVAWTNVNQPNIVQFITGVNNTTQTTIPVLLTATAVPTGAVVAMDFDNAGNLWVLDANGNCYELLKASNYPLGSIKFTVQNWATVVAPPPTIAFDWTISYLTGDLFLFTDQTVGGTLYKIDSTNGNILSSVSNALDAGITNPAYGLGTKRGDVEIDHRIFAGEHPLAEQCRLIVSGGNDTTGQAGIFARYDQNLTLLATWDNNQLGGGTCNNTASTDGARYLIFDPIDHADNALDHTMWAGSGGFGFVGGIVVWATACRPAPADWDGY